MDGLPTAGAPAAASLPLPSLGLPPGSGPTAPPPAAPHVGGPPAPVGRPSADPEKQEQRVTKRAEINRLMELLPKTATDSKIYVYRIRGHNRREHRRCHTILMSEIEESGGDSEDYILNSILEECGEGKYECVAMSKANKRIPEFQPWQVIVGEYEDEDADEEHDFIHPPAFNDASNPAFDPRLPPHLQHLNPAFRNGSRYDSPPPAPPTVHPPANVLETMKAINENDREEKRDTMTLLVSMMNQNMQVLMQTQQQTQAEQARIAAEREAREEKWRQEAQAREQAQRDRDAQRASERTQLIATLVPLLLPMFQKMMEGKKDELTPMLLTQIFKEKEGSNSTEQAINLLMEANRQTVIAQGEANRQNLAMQGETQKQLMTHVLAMAQDAMQAQRDLEAGVSEDAGPIDKFLGVIERFGPMLGGLVQSASNQPAVAPQPPQQILPPPQPPAEATPAQTGTPKQQPPPPADGAEQEGSYSDDQLIGGCLDTIRKMQTGEVPQDHFGHALLWCAQAVPESMEEAILAQNQAQVFALATPVVKSHPKLLEWIKQPETNDFLSWSIEQIRLILMKMHEQAAKEGIDNDGEVVAEEADDFDDVTAGEKPEGDETAVETGEVESAPEEGGKMKPPPPPQEDLPPPGTVEDDSGLGEVEKTDFPPTDISQDIPPQDEAEGEPDEAEEG